eukprot:1934422-Amphidinium_carterae.1
MLTNPRIASAGDHPAKNSWAKAFDNSLVEFNLTEWNELLATRSTDRIENVASLLATLDRIAESMNPDDASAPPEDERIVAA